METLWAAALRPWAAFPQWALNPPPLGAGVRRMLRWRLPLTFLEGLLGWWSMTSWLKRVPELGGATFQALARERGLDPGELKALIAQLPTPPPMAQAWPWLLIAAPILLLGTWLHHAVWDHSCLWMLGGLNPQLGFRASLEAETEALTVGSVGALLGLLGLIPIVGLVLALPLALVNVWFWGLRGFALAARHGCPAWKGVVATGLHLLLMGCCGLGLAWLCIATLLAAMAGGA